MPLYIGMPGPSYTWSAFAASVDDAVLVIESGRIMTLVIERLDESLIAARHYLNWSLADMVSVKNRKG